MLKPLRRVAVAAAAGLMLAAAPSLPAGAEEVSCPSAEDLQTSLDEAAGAVLEAKAEFKASNRPLGRLVAQKRRETRAEVKQFGAELRSLRQAMRAAQTPEDQAAAEEAYVAARTALKEARRLLEYKRALLAEIKADRRDAKAAWVDARGALSELRALEESCSGDMDPAPEPEPEPEPDPNAPS